MTLTDKQKEAIGAMLELYKGGSITSDTAMTVIEAVFEGSASVQYIPYTLPPSESPYKWPETPNPFGTVTWSASKTEGGQGNG